MLPAIDLKGRRIERILVIERRPKSKSGHVMWLCHCDCGKDFVTSTGSLRRPDIHSCGCYSHELCTKRLFRHGHTVNKHPTKTWHAWVNMRRRCKDPGHKKWKQYGGRGITVCERWKDYSNFLADMGEKPEGMSLARIDNDGNYEPCNCEWQTQKQQQNNRGNNHRITFKSRTMTLAQWSEYLGLNYDCLKYRIQANWPLAKALQGKP